MQTRFPRTIEDLSQIPSGLCCYIFCYPFRLRKPIVYLNNICLYRNLTLAEANVTKRANIRVVAIGVGSEYDLNELNSIASDPLSQNVFSIQNVTALASILSEIRTS